MHCKKGKVVLLNLHDLWEAFHFFAVSAIATIYKLMILREDGEVVDPHIQVHIPNLPQQQGVADCGVHAIAYAFHAARRDSLEDIEFEQDKNAAALS